MSSLSLDEFLASFRNRTKLRGNSFQEKFDNFLTRLEKVAVDCENSEDRSLYREKYGEIHRMEFQSLTIIKASFLSEIDLKSALTEYIMSLTTSLIKVMSEYEKYDDFDAVGVIDSLGYIIVELEEVLK